MLYQLLHKASQAAPEKTAIVCGRERISYGRLIRGAEDFAGELCARGVGESDCVAVVLANGPAFVVTLFAAARERAVVLPLSPQLEDEALLRYFADARPRLIVTTHQHEARCRRVMQGLDPSVPVHVVRPSHIASTPAGAVPSGPAPHLGRALYLYTSGSEGYKKRICRSQENLYHEAMNFVGSAKLGPSDTILCLVPLYHSYGLGMGLLAAVGAGATLVLLGPGADDGAEELPFVARCREVLDLLEREAARMLVGVVYQYDALAQLPREHQAAMSSVRWAISAGNRLPLEVYHRFLDRFGVRIRQLYGSTETGSVAVNLVESTDFNPESVGACLENVSVRLVDEHGAEVADGEVGAVLVSSPVLPPGGYDGKPDATREAFAGGYYRTGDLGCRGANGILCIVGRKQTFIETAGYKVDPKEVEAVLLDHPKVSEVVVLGVDTPGLGQTVKAFVVPGAPCHEAELAAHCRDRLAAYKVPRAFELRDALPRSPLGKILKEVLMAPPSRPEGVSAPFALEVNGSRSLDGMVWRQAELRAPGPREVQIEVLAAGLNFLDLMLALGEIPDDAPGGSERAPRLGCECCGRVVAVGAQVEHVTVGDEVIALFPGCFASHVCVPAELVVRRPQSLAIEEAAALPVAFATAHYALRQAAGLAKDERVLVHAAAGGVGLAAIQIARDVGAEVVATAGSEAKRALLRSLGVAHVTDSRSLEFVDAVRAATGGEGVDVVLNSLAGDFIPASFGLLRDYGRFIELGKRDYYRNQQLGLQPFLRQLSFSLVDLRGMMFKRPRLVHSLLGEVALLAERGVYKPPIDRVFPAARIVDAFRHMAEAAHTGKIVIDLREPAITVQLPHESAMDAEQARFREHVLGLAPAARRAAVEDRLRDEIAATVRVERERVPKHLPLRALGFDSLTSIMLRNRLEVLLGHHLPVTLVFDHPTLEDLATALLERMGLGDVVSAPRLAAPRLGSTDEPIAVIGVGCRLPGGAVSSDSYWEMLWDGVDAIREVPPGRWDLDELRALERQTPGTVLPRWGGFLDGIDRFDPAFFDISSHEAMSMDPQQRLLLEVSWEALEDAGIPPDSLRGSQTAVFVGITLHDYGIRTLYPADLRDITLHSGTGGMFSIAAGRISYVLGLNGPSVALDTACSSSLMAVHLACQSLRARECNMALAAGVNLNILPNGSVSLLRMEALAADGRCKPFDASANGFVRSEGGAVIALKPLSTAMRDGDRVYAVIRGSASNQDGRSNGLTAPNGHAQEDVIRKALARAGVAPAQVGYVEAHGTGTRLGDPIEVHAMGAVLGDGRARDRPVIIGSVKSNVGHTEACAGIAGLLKAVLALQHRAIPATLHFRRPNPHIDWERLPVRVASRRMPWHTAGSERRIAGVSSFGFSGTNVHVVIEEAL
jgi:acyl-CoA synthetase (AMP-forming)/AMP-acid ligase II/NADPH:quinone reductase-like Zn-dependent oxidoreductase/3-oxoacyl-(acyl-carrier-protein) synthase/acyl carrier protein